MLRDIKRIQIARHWCVLCTIRITTSRIPAALNGTLDDCLGMTWRSYASSRRNLPPLPRSSPVSYNHENIYVYQPQVPGEPKRMKHSYPTSEALKFLLQMAHNREMALPDFQGDFVWDPSRRMSLSNRLSAT